MRIAPQQQRLAATCFSEARAPTIRHPNLPQAQTGLGKAETTIGGAKVGIVAEQGEIGGITTNRAMIRLKLKF